MNQIEERKVTHVRFPYGRIAATRRVIDELDGRTISRLLTRHLHCDWGDICDEDWKLNDHAVKTVSACSHPIRWAQKRCSSSPNGTALRLRSCLQMNIEGQDYAETEYQGICEWPGRSAGV